MIQEVVERKFYGVRFRCSFPIVHIDMDMHGNRRATSRMIMSHILQIWFVVMRFCFAEFLTWFDVLEQ